MKRWLKAQLLARGYEIRRVAIHTIPPHIPDRAFYDPVFSPWLGYGEFADLYRLVQPYAWMGPQSCYVLYSLASQALRLPGEIWECGVYQGGSALLLSELIQSRARAGGLARLRLFDTFEGMPEPDRQRDVVQRGDFGDTSLEQVRARVSGSHVEFHKGLIPATFEGLEGAKIAFAHIDVDMYASVRDCCAFIYPRMVPGGFMVFDDYGFAECPGARQAVDEYFGSRPERPLVLSTSQAIVFVIGGTSR